MDFPLKTHQIHILKRFDLENTILRGGLEIKNIL